MKKFLSLMSLLLALLMVFSMAAAVFLKDA